MKYILIPFAKILVWILFLLIYGIVHLCHFIWNLKPHPNAIDFIVGEDFYCTSHRASFDSHYFYKHSKYKLRVVPQTVFIYLIWLFKYGVKGEVLEISESEYKKAVEYWDKNEQNYENTKES